MKWLIFCKSKFVLKCFNYYPLYLISHYGIILYKIEDSVKLIKLNQKFRGESSMAKDKRFIKVYSQGAGSIEIWVDKETGVNYLYRSGGYGGGMTVLVNNDGKPVISHIDE